MNTLIRTYIAARIKELRNLTFEIEKELRSESQRELLKMFAKRLSDITIEMLDTLKELPSDNEKEVESNEQ